MTVMSFKNPIVNNLLDAYAQINEKYLYETLYCILSKQ